MRLISTKTMNSLRAVQSNFFLDGSCVIYAKNSGTDSLGSPIKSYSVQRSGNTYPLNCRIQDNVRIARIENTENRIEEVADWTLVLPYNAVIQVEDHVVITDLDTGAVTTLHVISVLPRTDAISLRCYCKQIN